LSTIEEQFILAPDAEITLEANPGTVSLEYWLDLHSTGVNRLSLGLQSADADELRMLERQHDFTDAVRALRWARKAGFDNINLDLIYGLPYQSIERWGRTLELVLGLGAEHLSLYALSLEHGTPMHKWVNRGLLPEPDADLAADMYELAGERLEKAGYIQYEISNWAVQKGDGTLAACRHNLQYWRLLPYLGFGAGAHGFVPGTHTANVLSPGVYIKRLRAAVKLQSFPRTPATANVERLSREEEMSETMIMGLRLVAEGVSRDAFKRRFGIGLHDAFGLQIEALIGRGLLVWRGDSLRLTPGARILGNQVFREFV
jgi:oxygen-independent coproporphyrinogen-3 oxidase